MLSHNTSLSLLLNSDAFVSNQRPRRVATLLSAKSLTPFYGTFVTEVTDTADIAFVAEVTNTVFSLYPFVILTPLQRNPAEGHPPMIEFRL